MGKWWLKLSHRLLGALGMHFAGILRLYYIYKIAIWTNFDNNLILDRLLIEATYNMDRLNILCGDGMQTHESACKCEL